MINMGNNADLRSAAEKKLPNGASEAIKAEDFAGKRDQAIRRAGERAVELWGDRGCKAPRLEARRYIANKRKMNFPIFIE